MQGLVRTNHQKSGGISMNHYEQEINLYFELKGTPESSRESYLRRINAFVNFMQDKHKCREDIQGVFINFYTLYEQTYTLSPQQAKACNDKICLSFMEMQRNTKIQIFSRICSISVIPKTGTPTPKRLFLVLWLSSNTWEDTRTGLPYLTPG